MSSEAPRTPLIGPIHSSPVAGPGSPDQGRPLAPSALPPPASLPEEFLFASSAALLLSALLLAGSFFDSELLFLIYGGRDSPALEFWRIISQLGSGWALIPVAAVFGALFAWVGREDCAAWLIGGLAMTASLAETLKWLVDRVRPQLPFLAVARGSSFPSGHAAESLFVYLYLWVVLHRTSQDASPPHPRSGRTFRLRTMFLLVLLTLPLLVGYSRIFLGVHWPSDVLGGWAIGFFVLAIALLDTAPPLATQSHGGDTPAVASLPNGN